MVEQLDTCPTAFELCLIIRGLDRKCQMGVDLCVTHAAMQKKCTDMTLESAAPASRARPSWAVTRLRRRQPVAAITPLPNRDEDQQVIDIAAKRVAHAQHRHV